MIYQALENLHNFFDERNDFANQDSNFTESEDIVQVYFELN